MDKEGIQGKPDIPNSQSPETMMSKDPGAGRMPPAMTSLGGLESGPPEAATRAILLEDKGVRGAGRVIE
jgi:hypothetical protein